MADTKTTTATKVTKPAASSAKTETVKAAKTATAKPAKAATPKAATPKAATPKAKSATAKPATARVSKAKSLKNVSPEQRYAMICEAAYFKAEQRGFSPENEIQDWIEAETEINRLLGM